MELVIRGIGRLLDALVNPFDALSPIVGLAAVSLLTAAGTLLIFKTFSNQQQMAAAKRSIHAAFLEMLLFRDDIRAVFRSQVKLLRHNLTYLRRSLVPTAIALFPLVVLLAQMQARYGYDGIEVGQPVLIKALLRGDPPIADARRMNRGVGDDVAGPTLEAPVGVRLETPTVWIPGTNEAIWRIAADRPGRYQVRIRIGRETWTKTVDVSDRVASHSPVRAERSLLGQWLHPAETPLPHETPLRALTVDYPERVVNFLGWDCHWTIPFFALSVLFTLALRRPLGVVL